MEYTTEEIIERVRGDIYALTNFLTEINEQYDLDMWDEVLEYLKEKSECDENYNKSK